MTVPEIISNCRRLGVSLRPAGDRLAVRPVDRATPDLLEAIRAHKRDLLDLLEAERHGLHPTCAPWLYTARQVLAGEFDGGTRSEIEAAWIGVRNIAHPACRDAKARLEVLLGKRPKEATR